MRTYALVGVAIAGFMTAVLTAQTRSALGTPLAGLTPVEFQEFRLGLDDFLEVEFSEEGLGPAFNGTSCAVCHNIPTIGGAGTMAELRAGRRNANGEFETLDASGDTLFHMFSVPGHGCQPTLPPDTNVFARRVPIPLFGADSSRPFPIRRCSGSKIRSIATATASAAAPRSSSTSKPATGASDGSGGKRSMPRS